ncbi:MAG: alpha/beta hydrolase [Acidobacteriota bacterium]
MAFFRAARSGEFRFMRKRSGLMIRVLAAGLVLFAASVVPIAAQEFVPLYPDGKMPNSKGLNLKEEIREERIYQVGTPGFRAYLPASSDNKRVAVLIIPGGGYVRIAYQSARTSVAKWLNSLGIAAFALDYRLPTSPDLMQKELAPLQDAERAMRLIRANAKKWNIDPDKIGVMGTSAGGHAASYIATTSDDIAKIGDTADAFSFTPNFMILASPVITMGEFAHGGSKKYLLGETPSKEMIERYSTELHVTEKTPPAFIFLAADDKSVNPQNSLMFFGALLVNKVSASLHVFPQGGHSIPLKNGPGSSSEWTKLCEMWMAEMNILSLEKK